MQLDTLQTLYVDELRDLYNAENQLLKAIPKLAQAASSRELKAGFQKHLEQTKGHVARLQQIFESLQEDPKGQTCKAMQGLIQEESEMLEDDAEPEVRDAGLICAAQKVEHYEIASYGTVRTYATLLGHGDAASLLQETLDEEAATDRALTDLAASINVTAVGGRRHAPEPVAGRATSTR